MKYSNLTSVQQINFQSNQVINQTCIYHTVTHICIYIQYTELTPKLSAMASVAQLVDRWSRDTEDAGSIPSWGPWSCIFRN